MLNQPQSTIFKWRLITLNKKLKTQTTTINSSNHPSHFEEHNDSDNEVKEEKQKGQDDEMFMGLINKIKIQKFYIDIRIIINDFVLDTMTLFDT